MCFGFRGKSNVLLKFVGNEVGFEEFSLTMNRLARTLAPPAVPTRFMALMRVRFGRRKLTMNRLIRASCLGWRDLALTPALSPLERENRTQMA